MGSKDYVNRGQNEERERREADEMEKRKYDNGWRGFVVFCAPLWELRRKLIRSVIPNLRDCKS